MTPQTRNTLHEVLMNAYHKHPEEDWYRFEREAIYKAAKDAGLTKTVKEIELCER